MRLSAYDSALTFLSPTDRARYTQLSRILRPTDSLKLAQMSPAERAATERMYWMMADPLMLTPGNEHWLEFLSRVAFAELRWTSDDWGLRGADTDRGVVYVRFGPPSTIMTLGGNTGSVSLLWRYDDGLSFHFALIPSLVEVNEVTPLPNGGHCLRFVALGRRGKRCEWVSEQIERVPNKLVVVHAHTEGIATIATRRFEPTPPGTRMATELECRVELPWPQKVLTPLIEFQLRRPMRRQLRSLLALVKERVEAGHGVRGSKGWRHPRR